MTRKIRILVISYYYTPALTPRAFRWTAIGEQWAKKGIVVDVVCARTQKGLAPIEQLNGVTIYRVSDPSQGLRLPVNCAHSYTSDQNGVETNRVKGLLKRLIKQLAVSFRWPDHAWFWILPAYVKARKLLRISKYDGIVSVAHPFSSHIVAFLLGKRRNGIPWVCDYGDPFSFLSATPTNNLMLYRRLNARIEKKVMKASRCISVTTAETAQEYERHLRVNQDWFRIIPPLVNQRYIRFANETARKHSTETETVRLVFAGNLYATNRSPRVLLQLLVKIKERLLSKELRVHFYGEIRDCWKEFKPYEDSINDWIFLHGTVNRDDLLNIYYEKADVLVNIGNSTTYQVPSKVAEYIATGLPILNIVSVPTDLSVLMLQPYPLVCTILGNENIDEVDVDRCVSFLSRLETVDPKIIRHILVQHQPEAVAGAYLSMMSGSDAIALSSP